MPEPTADVPPVPDLSHNTSVLLVPFIAVLFPFRAGQRMRDPGWFVTLLLVGWSSLAIGVLQGVSIWIYNEIGDRWGWFLWERSFAPSVVDRILITLLSMFEPGHTREILIACAFCFVFVSSFAFGAAVIAWPRVSRADSMLAGAFRALRCSYAASGLGLLLMAAVCLVANLAHGSVWFDLPFFLMAILVPLCSVVYVAVVVRVADGHCPPTPEGLEQATCENCGYELFGLSMEQRCPECGYGVGDSLDPDLARQDEGWAIHRNFGPTFFDALATPARFYRGLRVRRSLEGARLFSGLCGLTIYGGALLAGFGFMLLMLMRYGPGPGGGEMILLVGMIGSITLALCQWAHGLVTAVALLLVRLTRPLPDDRWLAHAACFEWSYCWVLAGFWGITACLFGVFQQPFTSLLGYIGGLPADLHWLFGGTAVIGLRWVWRYLTIARAIRWSNF